jgi:uncharacterized protein (DUF58 family)
MRSPWLVIDQAIGERTRRWARRRHGREASQLTLASQRIYILPTSAGLVYAAMAATMLAGSMNYSNNLAFGLTFLLASIGIVTIYQTHGMLSGLRVQYLGAEPVFAGDPLQVRFALVNESEQPREEIVLDWEGCAEIPGGVPALDSRTVRLSLPTQRRGPRPLPGLRVSCRAPLGLMRAWAWVHLEACPLVYPRPSLARVPAAHPETPAPAPGFRYRAQEDFAGLRAYQIGDSPRHIAWKSYAKTGVLLVRDYRGGSNLEPMWIDWDALPASDVETRVARLTRLVIEAFEEDRSWGLRVPGVCIDPAGGREHLHRCLRCLATTGLSAVPA